MTHPPTTSRQLLSRVFLPIVNVLLRLFSWKLPSYFSARERVSFLLFGFEKPLVAAIRGIIHPGSIILDIGANIGFISREFARLAGNNGRVAAFEPDPAAFDCLKFNSRAFLTIKPIHAAVSDSSGVCKLFLHPASGMSNSLVHEWENAEAIEVSSTTVDDWLAENPEFQKPHLVKIDVEGAEKRVLDGMRYTLRENPNVALIVEFCPKLLGGKDESRDLLKTLRTHGALFMITPSGEIRGIHDEETIYNNLNKDGFVNLVCRKPAIPSEHACLEQKI
jgi:FkbM family methyltransferase